MTGTILNQTGATLQVEVSLSDEICSFLEEMSDMHFSDLLALDLLNIYSK